MNKQQDHATGTITVMYNGYRQEHPMELMNSKIMYVQTKIDM